MTFDELEQMVVSESQTLTISVAGAKGHEVFEALLEAQKKKIAYFILTGEPLEIEKEAQKFGLKDYSVIPATTEEEACKFAVETVSQGLAHVLMKGKVATATLLKAVLDDKTTFTTGGLLSHLLVLETPGKKFLGITDGGMNLYPTLQEKQSIIQSAVECFHALGIPEPKVAVLAAMEKENPKIPESMDAGELKRKWQAGEMGGCIVDGPLALDLAVSPAACTVKEYQGPIQGDADILIVHDISSGNYLGKSLLYMAGYSGGGIILGSGRPIILLSRSDSTREKYQSILLAIAVEHFRTHSIFKSRTVKNV